MNARFFSILLAAVSSATCAVAIPPPRLPLPPATHEEPNLLSDYERTTVTLEMNNLTREISLARKEAAGDPTLDDAKRALDEALASKDANSIREAKRKLSDMTETILYRQEGMPEKIRRLLDVGKLLEYDTRRQKEIRRRKGTAFK